MAGNLEAEFAFYREHQDDLVKKYDGKVIAIKDKTVFGPFDSEDEAIDEMSKTHELGTFIVQRVEPGEDAYTQTFYSRVSFA